MGTDGQVTRSFKLWMEIQWSTKERSQMDIRVWTILVIILHVRLLIFRPFWQDAILVLLRRRNYYCYTREISNQVPLFSTPRDSTIQIISPLPIRFVLNPNNNILFLSWILERMVGTSMPLMVTHMLASPMERIWSTVVICIAVNHV